MKLTEAKKQKARELLPHVLAGVAVMLDVPVKEFEQWAMSNVHPKSLAEKSCDVVTERAAPLVEKSAAAGIEGQPSETPATTQRTLGVNANDAKSNSP